MHTFAPCILSCEPFWRGATPDWLEACGAHIEGRVTATMESEIQGMRTLTFDRDVLRGTLGAERAFVEQAPRILDTDSRMLSIRKLKQSSELYTEGRHYRPRYLSSTSIEHARHCGQLRGGRTPKAMDNLTPEQRSRTMSLIRSKDTQPELTIRRLLHARGLRFRKHVAWLPGQPDIVFVSAKVTVFVDGDYWHGWRFPLWSGKLTAYWKHKIEGNRRRDGRNVSMAPPSRMARHSRLGTPGQARRRCLCRPDRGSRSSQNADIGDFSLAEGLAWERGVPDTESEDECQALLRDRLPCASGADIKSSSCRCWGLPGPAPSVNDACIPLLDEGLVVRGDERKRRRRTGRG